MNKHFIEWKESAHSLVFCGEILE